MKKKYFYPLSEDGITNQDISAAKKVLNSKQLTMSRYTRKFEKEFSKKIGAKQTTNVRTMAHAGVRNRRKHPAH